MTQWKLTNMAKGLRPLAVVPEGLVCHHRGALYMVGHDLKCPTLLCRLPGGGFARAVARRFRLLDRVLRASPTHAVVVGDAVLVARRSEIWRCSLSDGSVNLDFQIPDGRRSLGFGLIEQPDGSTDVVFGEYFQNFAQQPVRIWGRSGRDGRWTERTTFGAGEIEHIHAISAIRGHVYVLTGDFGAAAGIWVSDAAFSGLRPLLRGQQAFRAAWMDELGGQVYYATDTQLEVNQLHMLCMGDGGAASVRALTALGGSSIYAGRGRTEIFFSTTIECGPPTGSFLKDMLDTRPAAGMSSAQASILAVDGQGQVSKMFSAKKDAWPFRLAQFGTFMFPSGLMPLDTLIAYGVAIGGADDTCLVFKRR